MFLVGPRKGDRLSVYLPMVVELPVSMLACARIGAVHSVAAWRFKERPGCAERPKDSQPKGNGSSVRSLLEGLGDLASSDIIT